MNKEKSANRKKKMNTYVKYGLLMLVCTAGGGLLGFLSTFAEAATKEQLKSVHKLIKKVLMFWNINLRKPGVQALLDVPDL